MSGNLGLRFLIIYQTYLNQQKISNNSAVIYCNIFCDRYLSIILCLFLLHDSFSLIIFNNLFYHAMSFPAYAQKFWKQTHELIRGKKCIGC